MNPTRVLYCIDALVRGGTELQLLGLIERLDRREFQPYLVTIRRGDAGLQPVDCSHLEWNVPKLFAPQGVGAVVRLAQYLRRNEISVVQTFFQDSTVFGGIAARLAGVPVRIAAFRDLGFWRTPAQEALLRTVYPSMTGFLCNSDAIRDHIVERERIAKDRIQIVRNGVDLDALPWIDHDGPTLGIGIVGNLTRKVKRPDLFLRAAAIVAREHPEVTWHIVGDGHMRAEMESLAGSEGLVDKVKFAGRIQDVAGYLAKLEVGVICSDTEGLSNALLEYMFRGVMAIATDVGGNRELIEHERTGLLIPPDSVEGLAAAMTRSIEDVQIRRTLAAAARTAVAAEYGWSRSVSGHMAVYRTALCARRCARPSSENGWQPSDDN